MITWLAVSHGMGFAEPMLIFTMGALISFIVALLLGPETKGKEFVADLEIQPIAQMP